MGGSATYFQTEEDKPENTPYDFTSKDVALFLERRVNTPPSNGQHIRLWPNPTNGVVYFSGVEQAGVKVFDRYFRLILEGNIQNSTLDISGLPNGIYFLQVSYGQGLSSLRVIKQ